ncbi:MAG: Ig-like domain-containing protein, partial [Clostridia bacterium]|nr:Ig-like domain-containing protein [Clostridia bacterium]
VKTRSVSMSWKAAVDNVMVDYYEIYRDGVKVGETTDLTYTDGQLSDNTAYVYTVKAVDTRKNVSEASTALNVTTLVAPEGAAVSGIVIKEEYSTITVGKTLALTVEITPADAVNKLVEWTSSNESVATVDENGVVTAVGEGEAVITGVTDDGAYAAETIVIITNVTPGDVSEDGTVDSWDATLVLRHDAGLTELTGNAILAADVSGDGVVDSWDATLILRFDAGLIEAFPVE